MSGDTNSPVPLSYEPSRPHQHLMRRVWWIVLLLVAGMFGLIALLLWPSFGAWRSEPAGPLSSGLVGASPAFLLALLLDAIGNPSFEEGGYAPYASIYLLLLFFLQWLFFVPRGSWRIRLDDEGRPVRRSVIAAAAIAMLLSAGALGLVLDWPLADPLTTPWHRADILAPDPIPLAIAVSIAMASLWLLWSIVFWAVTRYLDRRSALVRLYRALVAGTVLELVIAIPAHVYVARREDCYCTRGSYCAFVMGLTAAIWLFGPGIYFVLIREKRRLDRP